MNDRFFVLAIAVLIFLLGSFASCERVIALDKGIENAEGSTADKQGGSDETTATGNPAEDLAEGPDSPAPDGFSSDVSALSDEDIVWPKADEEWGGENSSDGTGSYSDADVALSDSTFLSDDEDATTPDTDTAPTFSVSDCGCGEQPTYDPVCCDGKTTIFNKCFANCLNYYTGQCLSQEKGPCGSSNDGGSDTDEIEEVPDDDILTVGSCECAPADLNPWCCEGNRYFGECTALCACEEIPAPCR